MHDRVDGEARSGAPRGARPEPSHDGVDGSVDTVLQRLVVASALWVVTVSALGGLLGGLGLWWPWLVWPLVAALSLPAWRVTARATARVTARATARATDRVGWPAIPLSRRAATTLGLIVTALTLWTGATHGEQVLPRRDAGSNAQAAISLARTGERIVSLPADLSAAAQTPGVTAESPAFYEVTSSDGSVAVEPQFVIGPAALYSLGDWLAGPSGMLLLPAVFTGLWVLGVALLVGRFLGGTWAVWTAVLLAVLYPVVHAGRLTYSEPLACLTVSAALLAFVVGTSRAAALAGFLCGATLLVRVDGLREAALLLSAVGLYAAQRTPWVRHLVLGLLAGGFLGGVSLVALSGEYAGSIRGSLLPLVALAAALAGGTAAIDGLARRGVRLPDRLRCILSGALPVLLALVGIGLASRPLWQVVRQSPDDPGSVLVANLQRAQGLAVDGGRTYAESTVLWLSWWVGPLALLVTLAVVVLLGRVAVDRWAGEFTLPLWVGPVLVAVGSSVLILYRPGITPDHPWAERRILIPLVLVAVSTVVAAATLWAAGPGARGRRVAAVGVLAAYLVPTLWATASLATIRTERGSIAAVTAVCRALDDRDVVLAIDDRAANEWPQVLRGTCGRPAFALEPGVRADPTSARAAAEALAFALPSGRRLVLLAADGADTVGRWATATFEPVVDVETREDQRLLERRPSGTNRILIQVWLAPVQGRS